MIQDVLKDADGRMSKSIDSLHRDLSTIRTGRANPALLDRIMVEAYGGLSPINQVASISVPDPRLLVIQPWDKSVIPSIERAIQKSDIGITPSSDGVVIRLALPPLNEERRKQLVKQVHTFVEDAKVSLRNIRRDAMSTCKDLLNEKMISEDDERRAESQVTDLTKKFSEEAEKIGKTKEHEVMEV
ncbi:MAG: ribosome recycling factor [Thermomicrobiales bacterium]